MAVNVNTVLECIRCGDQLTVPFHKIREVTRWAEDNHHWLATGSRGTDNFVCPKHEVPCTRCLQPTPVEVEIATRKRSRAYWQKG